MDPDTLASLSSLALSFFIGSVCCCLNSTCLLLTRTSLISFDDLWDFSLRFSSTAGKAGDKKFSDAMRHDNGIGFGLGFLDLYSQSRRQRCIWYRCSTIFFWHESHPKRDEEGIKKWSTFLSSSKDDLKDRKEKEERSGKKKFHYFFSRVITEIAKSIVWWSKLKRAVDGSVSFGFSGTF